MSMRTYDLAKILHFFTYILHHSLSKTFYTFKELPTFHVLVAKVYVVTGAHYVT